MNTIIIDSDKCKKDGLCIEECPFNFFTATESGIPTPANGYENDCMNCGHCIAICPGDAITLNGHTSADCDKIGKDTPVSRKQIEQLLQTRRSIRNFKDIPVEKKTIEDLINLSRWAPTAKNRQPVNWLAVRDRETIHKYSAHVIDWFKQAGIFPSLVEAFLTGEDMVLHDAPCLLIAHASAKELSPVIDCSIAVASIETAVPSFGLGACWAGFFMAGAKNYKPLMEELNLPENHEVQAALMLGVPKHNYKRIPPRMPAKIEWR